MFDRSDEVTLLDEDLRSSPEWSKRLHDVARVTRRHYNRDGKFSVLLVFDTADPGRGSSVTIMPHLGYLASEPELVVEAEESAVGENDGDETQV